MPSLNKRSDLRRPHPSQGSGDYVPLLSIRRGSRNQNVWNDDDGQDITPARNNLEGRRSSEPFNSYLEYTETSRLSTDSGVFHDPDSRSLLAKTNTEDLIIQRSVRPSPI